MKVLITGGAGYLGTSLVHELVARNEVEEVIIYDNLSRSNNGLFIGTRFDTSKVKFEDQDLLDSRSLDKALKGIDVVYHLAAKVSTPFANIDAHAFEQINHWGTAELVYACERANVKRLIYTSSASVYGHRDEMITEATAPKADSYYGLSKLRGEEHVLRSKQMDTQVIRLGNIYGFNHSIRFDAVINRFLFDAHFLGRVTINGDGHQKRSFIHVNKAAAALASLIIRKVPTGIHNLSDRNMSIMDVVETLLELKPGLEFFLVGQHQRLKGHTVSIEGGIREHIDIQTTSFRDELEEALSKFSF